MSEPTEKQALRYVETDPKTGKTVETSIKKDSGGDIEFIRYACWASGNQNTDHRTQYCLDVTKYGEVTGYNLLTTMDPSHNRGFRYSTKDPMVFGKTGSLKSADLANQLRQSYESLVKDGTLDSTKAQAIYDLIKNTQRELIMRSFSTDRGLGPVR